MSLVSISPTQAQTSTPTPIYIDIAQAGGRLRVDFETNTPVSMTETPTPTETSTNTPTYTVTATQTSTIVPTQTPTYIPLQDSGWEFYRDAGTGLACVTSTTWGFPGAALTASTRRFYGDLMKGRQILQAIWLLAWNPATGSIPTGVQLVKFDNGPLNIESIAIIESASTYTPIGSGVYITEELQAILDAGEFKQLGQRTHGNGSNGCLIYASWIEIIWKEP